MLRKLIFSISIFILAFSIFAELRIEITKGSKDPIKLAIVPIEWAIDSPASIYLHEVITKDLEFLGEYSILRPEKMLSLPSVEEELFYRDWRLLDVDYLLLGRAESLSTSKEFLDDIEVSYSIYDVSRQKRLHKAYIRGSLSSLRSLAHGISDSIYKKISGIKGIFSTRILYVDGSNYSKNLYQLRACDFDGMRDLVLVSSDAPIISPSWSSDGKLIAYVSFESGTSNIYIQSIKTGERSLIDPQEGLNSAPVWSSNNKFLAAVLSQNGNSDIYRYNIKKKLWKRLTDHYAIDTEPDWSKNSKKLLFTSNRSGSPQIYELKLSNGRMKRLTFKGSYNARARYLPNGKDIVYVHRENGVFHIAKQNIRTGEMTILTDTNLDESPTVAPNGNLIMYATQHKERKVLAGISIDGITSFVLPSTSGEVRDPSWSPFLN
tara:strand:- start:431 stop:1732 length:1302 start_codon:yes stop_codon:yes gene_type:complete